MSGITRAGCALVALTAVFCPTGVFAQGLALSGVGPINRSMGGAATGAPLDAMGALHWNPAGIAALPATEMSFGLELLLPEAELSSTIPAGALGGGSPPVTLSGTDSSDSGVAPIPTFGFVHKDDCSRWTYGLGIYGIAGYRVNYPASLTDPILTPQPSRGGLGVGRLFAEAELFQIAPTLAYVVSPNLSIGFAPTITLGRLSMDPALLAPPDFAGGGFFPTYPMASGTRYHWGGGLQVGAYYTTDYGWHLGATLKSPQWMEDFRFHSEDGAGMPRTLAFDIDYPAIVSLGLGYSGFECWTLAADFRYFDWANTDGFRTASFAPTGEVTGLGWSNTYSIHTGAQYQASPCMSWRLGYYYTTNPISDANASFNIASPLISQHVASVGFSRQMGAHWIFSLAYIHGFENSVSGPIHTALGTIPGSSVQSEVSAHALTGGVSVRF